MTKIRCYYLDCLFLDERHCTAAAVDINPDSGCLTYRPIDDEESLGDWDDELESWDDEDEDSESLWEIEEEEDELDDVDY
ncbi:MAG: hypothetical protein ACOYKC_05880 [Anaerolineaceae bacterium]|jgi:hypothetical protein